GTETCTVGIRDTYAARGHVVDEPRELVDAVDGDVAFAAQPQSAFLEVLHGARTVVRPHHVREVTEHAVQVLAVRGYESMREQVQPEIHVVCVGGLGCQ